MYFLLKMEIFPCYLSLPDTLFGSHVVMFYNAKNGPEAMNFVYSRVLPGLGLIGIDGNFQLSIPDS